MPLKATKSLLISSAKRFASKHHDSLGTHLNIRNGIRDSSCMPEEYNETANVRPNRKNKEK